MLEKYVETGFIQVAHIEGKNNFTDIMTKEDKDPLHFISIVNVITCVIPKPITQECSKGGIVTSEAQCDIIDTSRCEEPTTTHKYLVDNPS